MKLFKKVVCVNAGQSGRCLTAGADQSGRCLTAGKEYEVLAEGSKYYKIVSDRGKIAHFFKSRFKEIEMKEPPVCNCHRATAPKTAETYHSSAQAKVPTETEASIVKNNIIALADGLKAGRTTLQETRLVLETCLFILKGE